MIKDIRMHDWDAFMYEERLNDQDEDDLVEKHETKPVVKKDDWWNRTDRCPLGGSL